MSPSVFCNTVYIKKRKINVNNYLTATKRVTTA